MKTIIDKEACIGCGLCPSMCPELYEMGDDGKAVVQAEAVPRGMETCAKEAAEACPTIAIVNK